MAAGDPITDLSDLIFLATGGGGGSPELVNWHKHPFVGGAAPGTLVAGRLTSLWMYDGAPSGASNAAPPTTSAVTTNATDGAFKQATSAASTKKRLLSFSAVGLVAGSLILYDRLVHQGGLSGVTTGAQTTNLPTSALTRQTTGVGVELWLEIYTLIGVTGTTVTASYTNTVPTSGRTTKATSWGNTGFREAQRVIPLPLAIGDNGVTAVASVTNAATTGTAGAFGVTLAYPLVVLPLPVPGAGRLWSGIMTAGGPLSLGATSDACLAMAWFPNTATAPQLFGQAFFVEK